MSETRIVQAGLQHLDALVPLFDAYRVFYEQESDVEKAEAFLRERLTGLESIIFLAFQGDKPSGFTQLYPSFSSVSLARIWILNDLFVTPESRGKGTAAALLQRAATFAENAGALRLSLATQVENVTAQRLYERLGWQREDGFYHYSLTVRRGV